jgi:hypothetical protein
MKWLYSFDFAGVTTHETRYRGPSQPVFDARVASQTLVTLINIAQLEREVVCKLSLTSTDSQALEKRPSPWRTEIFLPSGAGITKTEAGTRYASDAIEPQPRSGTPPGSRFCKAPTPAIRWICRCGCRIGSNLD